MAFSWDAQSLRAAIDDPQRSLAALRVANQGSGRHELTGAEAVAFFTGSGLPQETLSSIWMASTKGAPEMGPQMFLEALKLAYAALHGGNPSSSSGAASGLSQSPGGPASFSSHGGGGGPTPEERQKYAAHYATLPGANVGQVSTADAADFLSKAKIKRELIQEIVARNALGAATVTLDAFVQSMHETYEARKAKKEKKGIKSAAKAASAAGAFAAAGSTSWRSAPVPPPLEPKNPPASSGPGDSVPSAFASFDAPPLPPSGGEGGGGGSGGGVGGAASSEQPRRPTTVCGS